jgi:hypothetical protein
MIPWLNFCVKSFRLIGIIYYLVSLSFRLCFDAFSFSSVFGILIALDYITDTLYFVDYFGNLVWLSHAPISSINEENLLDFASLGSIKMMTQLSIKSDSFTTISNKILLCAYHIILFIPFECIGYGLGFTYYPWLRLTKLGRLFFIVDYFYEWQESIENMKIEIKSGVYRAIIFFLLQLFLSHFVACTYYFLSIESIHAGETKSWLLRDGLVSKDDDGNIVFLRDMSYVYLRAVYFAVQTLVSNIMRSYICTCI